MPLAAWLRALDLVVGVSHLARRVNVSRSAPGEEPRAIGERALGQVEARLAGAVVGALKEAFDRDSARLELERAQMEAERRRAEEALQLEILTRAGDRQLAESRLQAALALTAWAVSVLFLTFVVGGMDPPLRGVLGAGWLLLLGALGCSLHIQARVAGALARSLDRTGGGLRRPGAAAVAPWLLLGGLLLTAASVLLSL